MLSFSVSFFLPSLSYLFFPLIFQVFSLSFLVLPFQRGREARDGGRLPGEDPLLRPEGAHCSCSQVANLKTTFHISASREQFFYFIHFRNVGVGGLEVGVKDEVNP